MAQELVLRFLPQEERVIAELPGTDGVMITKDLDSNAVLDCVRSSLRYSTPGLSSGLLPPRCLAYGYADGSRSVFLEYPYRYANITYQETEYPHFPLPRMVFGFVVSIGGRVLSCKIGVMANEEPSPQTAMYLYPFSNMSNDNTGDMCLGSNDLPTFTDVYHIGSLCSFILGLPNNDDNYSKGRSKLGLEYRALMEHLKDKDPDYYYGSVLIPSGQTLQQFINGGGNYLEA